ncbi:hypothetical protein [Candidatus Contubernalis alkaliaceticus]|uniref:hypothetical protein n=1 Tax=Candidatus Contubernalis alkaliaceticus TaxID=338645 RepID=UPI001F4C5152|nr:hypothetical protein [Candidatus Contubernalis alkalaceticus]UNC93020.1 hypothetical protein HUE98_13515 [Candidatus Contubernalis alkalaceticus]
MKKFLKKLGFNRADEMDMYIANLSMRNQLLLVYIFLFIWILYDFFTSKIFGLPFFLLILTGIVNSLSLLYYRKKLVGKDAK